MNRLHSKVPKVENFQEKILDDKKNKFFVPKFLDRNIKKRFRENDNGSKKKKSESFTLKNSQPNQILKNI